MIQTSSSSCIALSRVATVGSAPSSQQKEHPSALEGALVPEARRLLYINSVPLCLLLYSSIPKFALATLGALPFSAPLARCGSGNALAPASQRVERAKSSATATRSMVPRHHQGTRAPVGPRGQRPSLFSSSGSVLPVSSPFRAALASLERVEGSLGGVNAQMLASTHAVGQRPAGCGSNSQTCTVTT